MSGFAKSPELPLNLFLEPRPIERENKVAAAGPINSVDRRGQTSSLAGVAMTKKHEFHDLASIFPMLAGDEAKALADDISKHGLREPIALLEGKILDGRNRYNACLDAGVEPRFTHYSGDNPAAYVVSLNLKRRHLNESQRAMVAKKLATLEHGQRQTGKFAGVTKQPEAASMLNVSERSVRTAGAVIDKAVPEIVKAVEKGDVSVSAAAQFAKQPKEEQAKQITESAKPADAVKAFRDSRQIRSAEAVGDDGPRSAHPSDSKAVTHMRDVVKRFADFCRTSPATSVAASVLPGEIDELRISVAVVFEWLDRFAVALDPVEGTKTGCPPDVPSSARQPTPATSMNANDRDLPSFHADGGGAAAPNRRARPARRHTARNIGHHPITVVDQSD
jgi:hypothetical protein